MFQFVHSDCYILLGLTSKSQTSIAALNVTRDCIILK